MATLEADCDIILQHAAVNGGVGYGFLLVRYADKNQTVKVERWAYTDLAAAYVDRFKVSCRLYLRDGAKNPNGQIRAESRAEDYARLLSLLAQRTGLRLSAQIGDFTALHATLEVTEEFHHQSHSEIVLVLNNGGYDETVPIDFLDYNNSQWDGTLSTWGEAYWT